MLTAALLFAPSEEHHGGPSPKLHTLLGMTDAELVARLQTGDDNAYTTLYRVFHPRLVAIATGYVERPIAEELAHDVLILVWERRDTWTVGDGIGIYLYTAVRNRALKHIRHARVVARLEHIPIDADETPPGMGAAATRADIQLEQHDVRRAVDAALARVSEGARTAFLLRWMHELSYPEIARIMMTTEQTVRQQVAKARRAVIPVLEQLARGGA